LKISDFTEKDSCTWIIKAECGLPSITITDITEEIGEKMQLRFIEYEVDSTDTTLVNEKGHPTIDFIKKLKTHDLDELYSQNVGQLFELGTDSG